MTIEVFFASLLHGLTWVMAAVLVIGFMLLEEDIQLHHPYPRRIPPSTTSVNRF